jgi:Nucleotidyltransferase domain
MTARAVRRVRDDGGVLEERRLRELAERLVGVPGMRAVVLGGSRARGEHTAESDVDLGLYYRAPPDVEAVGAVARAVAGPAAQVTVPGAWGPWVDGGGWLRIENTPVDWIYRDLDRVQRSWRDAQDGHFRWHFQVGHPLGVPDFAYAAQAALAVVLADPTGELTQLQQETRHYPPRLRDALIGGLWEAGFCMDIARKAVSRVDSAYISGCLFRAVVLCAHALHGHAGRWLVNEKGAVTAAGRLPNAPKDFTRRAQAICANVGALKAELHDTLTAAQQLIDDTAQQCRPSRPANSGSGGYERDSANARLAAQVTAAPKRQNLRSYAR